MMEFSDKYKITKREKYGQTEFYDGINQKRLLPDTYISKRYPLLKYSNEVSGKLNGFVKEIDVDCLSGIRITMDGAVEPYSLKFKSECIAYATANDGEKFIIPNSVKEFFIFCKPDASVSKEGMLLFYYDMNIVATVAGNDWHFLSFDTEWAEDCVKKEIEKIDNIFSDYGKTIIRFTMEDGTKEDFELCFQLEFLGEDDIIQCCLSRENM